MEERIGFDGEVDGQDYLVMSSLNPYCNGRKNRMWGFRPKIHIQIRLNPYCNGRKNRIVLNHSQLQQIWEVLILIVMEERIGLVGFMTSNKDFSSGLNPYCNGRKNRIIR